MKLLITSICFLWVVCCAWASDDRSKVLEGIDSAEKPADFEKKCYPDIGCYSNGPPFYDPVHRPTSVVPDDCKDITFNLFTPKNPKKGQLLTLDPSVLKDSPFDPQLPTKFLFSGYMQTSFNRGRAEAMKDIFLKVGKYNMIIPDTSKYVRPPYYQAIANARTCGARVANLIHFIMKETGVGPETFHLLGYILGAQIAGYAAKGVKNISRVSALDPAGPGFENLPDEARLTYKDAKFVDVLHTNEGKNYTAGFGTASAIGHQDFYTVGGLLPDGCEEDEEIVKGDLLLEEGRRYISVCQTDRVLSVYAESLTSTDCHFMGVSCDSRQDFEEGRCKPDGASHVVAEMGLHARQVGGVHPQTKFFFRINDRRPYCVPNSASPS